MLRRPGEDYVARAFLLAPSPRRHAMRLFTARLNGRGSPAR